MKPKILRTYLWWYNLYVMSAKDILSRPETTHVLVGNDKVIKFSAEGLATVKSTIDLCGEYTMPAVVVSSEPVWNQYQALYKKGVKIRWITDIRNENISYCKDIMNIADVRHLDSLKGGFVVSDNSHYIATYSLSEAEPVLQLIYSNVKEIVEFQQYLFDTLWNKAVPAKRRLEELELGRKREFIDTIQDPAEIHKTLINLLNNTSREIRIIFPTAKTFLRYKNEGLMEILTNKAKHGVNVRMLVVNDLYIREIIEQIQKLEKIQILFLPESLNTRVTALITDNKYSLAVELNDDTKQTTLESTGLATYSNSESTVLSYTAIFETSWVRALN
jgi:two-component system sensor histidine kinase VicK